VIFPAAGSGFFYAPLKLNILLDEKSVLKYDSVFTGIHKSIDSLFSLFPNPILTHLTFHFDDVYPKIKCIAIYNLQGMKVLELRTSETRIMVNVENFPSGFYFVTIETPYAPYFRKFCKQ